MRLAVDPYRLVKVDGTAGLRAESIEVIPVGTLSTSAAAGVDGPVVMLSGEADATTAAQLRETLAAQLDTGARRVTVDASGLSFLDSASVRVLVLAARALRGGTARWCSRALSRSWPGCWKSPARTGCST
jgi:anti-anti-sigma factor